MTRFQKGWLMGWAALIAAWALVIGQGCGVSPEQAADELERLTEHPEEWCGWAHDNGIVDGVDKQTIPDDYGNTAAPGGCNSTGVWPGGFCWVPANTNITWQNTLNSGISSWNLAQTGAMNALESEVDPLSGWEITQVASGGNYETYVGTTHPQGFLGSANMFSYLAVATPQGEMRLYEFCSAVLFKTHILDNQFYQAASSSQKSKYIRNLHGHEKRHCIGAMHQTVTPNLLMSVNYTFPGAWFDSHLAPTAAELARMDAWVP